MPEPAAPASAGVGDFLEPKSMLTPGALGAIAALATNAFYSKFPELQHIIREPALLALIFSFLFGLAAIVKQSRRPERR